MRTKWGHIFIGSLLLLLISGFVEVYAQENDFFVVTGRLSADDGNNEGVQVQITKNDIEQQIFTPPRSGRFRFEFEYNNEFKMTFLKDGYYKKTIVVSTHVPQKVLEENSDFPPFEIGVSLVKEIPGVDKSFTNKPAGRVYYNGNIDNFDSEVFLSDLQFEEQAANARLREQELSQEERSALVQRDKDYEKSIADADALFRGKKYEEALVKFQYAHGLFPERPYPNDRIAELQDLVSALKLAEQRKQLMNQEYQQRITEADRLFDQKQYERAKLMYAEALEQRPDDSYATGQIAKADQLINQQKVDLQYNKLIADAAQLYSDGGLGRAKEVYQEAVLIKPEEAGFINEQIRKIDAELALQVELAQKESQYNEYIGQGTQAMQQKNYNEALVAFRQALTYKPDDELALRKISEAESIILQIQTQENYDKHIADADQAMKNNDLTLAKSLYQEALKHFPNQTYPKDKIAEIDQAIALDEQFNQLVSQAGVAENQQNFAQAKQLLEQALQIRDDAAVREQIQRIDQQLAQIQLDRNYADLIKRADEAKTNEQFEVAKSLYQQALAVLPQEQYPQDQIRLIDEKLVQLADAAKLEQQFEQTLATAEMAFDRKDYLKALEGFNAALAIKTDNQLVKGRISETEGIMLQLENKKKYDELVATANEAFNGNELEQAKGLYQQALSVLPHPCSLPL